MSRGIIQLVEMVCKYMKAQRIQQLKLFIATLLFTVTSVAVIPTAEVFAQSAEEDEKTTNILCDEQFYSSNDVLFYNPCATSCSANTGTSVSGPITKLRSKNKNNAEKIFNFWIDAGLSAQQAAGITASIKHESGFSPFRQEMSQSWPAGGWGIAQFTGGQRSLATKYVQKEVGATMFEQYYVPKYGGAVLESKGFIPDGVPEEVNDAFLLAELNYLLEYSKSFEPSSIPTRVNLLKRDFNQEVPKNMSLYDYLKTVAQAPDVAAAWTYLYEFPGDIKATSEARASTASTILELYGSGIGTSCGGNLVAGGMALDEAKKFMDEYKNNPSNEKYIGGAGRDCPGGPLSNCVSFTVYFINKYTKIQGFGDGTTPGNGGEVVANIIARNPGIDNGHSPRPYAIFSTPKGEMMCGSTKCGHTGVILGVDTKKDVVIVGEAGCGAGAEWDTAREYPLSQFDNESYTYAYTDSWLKEGVL